jgi:hypothetical protein
MPFYRAGAKKLSPRIATENGSNNILRPQMIQWIRGLPWFVFMMIRTACPASFFCGLSKRASGINRGFRADLGLI